MARTETAPLARRSRTIMVTYLGAVVRQLDEWMPIASTITLMAELGLDAPTVRTTVFRFKQRGWLESESQGSVRGYRMTETALSTFSAGDPLIWQGRQPAALDDGWCVINASIPESARARRHKLRAHLAHLGFGNVGTAMWLAPRSALVAAQQVVTELKLDDHVAIFTGDYVGAQNLASLVQQSWDLAEINEGYRQFVHTYRPLVDKLHSSGLSDAEAFATFLPALDRWRRLPFRDPGLPTQVLPADWVGPEAVEVIKEMVEELHEPALRHARLLWPDAS